MQRYLVDHLADPVVLRETRELARHGCQNTADLLARLALVDARRLYLPARYDSMHAWCMGELPFSDDSADRRIHAARAARAFPALFVAIAEGRLHLTAVGMLAPHLTRENADELLALASRTPKRQLERLLAERFPRAEAFGPPQSVMLKDSHEPAPARVLVTTSGHSSQDGEPSTAGSLALAAEPAPARVHSSTSHLRVTPLSADRLRLEGTIDRETDELLEEARVLLGHAVPSGNLALVLKHCLQATVTRLRQRKFGAGGRRRADKAPVRRPPNARHIPAAVRAAVWRRDGGMCTFVGDSGHRCSSRVRLEFDHVISVARGGLSTEDNLRLRCRAHNQYTAEREFGRVLIAGRREAARRRATEERLRRQADRERTEARKAEIARQAEELGGAFRSLGYRGADLARALAHCATRPDTPPEDRLRHALKCMAPNVRRETPVASAPA